VRGIADHIRTLSDGHQARLATRRKHEPKSSETETDLKNMTPSSFHSCHPTISQHEKWAIVPNIAVPPWKKFFQAEPDAILIWQT
jgi:hypothetical protein